MTTELVAFVAAAGFGAVIGLERQAGKHDESVVVRSPAPSPSTECCGINDVDAITLASANLVKDRMAPAVGAQTVLLAVSVYTSAQAGLAWRWGGAWSRRTVSAGLVPAAILGFLFLGDLRVARLRLASVTLGTAYLSWKSVMAPARALHSHSPRHRLSRIVSASNDWTACSKD